MNPYVDGQKIYRHGDATYDLWDLTPEQIDGTDQLPAAESNRPDGFTHWEVLQLAGERLAAWQDEHYRTGRTATHGESL